MTNPIDYWYQKYLQEKKRADNLQSAIEVAEDHAYLAGSEAMKNKTVKWLNALTWVKKVIDTLEVKEVNLEKEEPASEMDLEKEVRKFIKDNCTSLEEPDEFLTTLGAKDSELQEETYYIPKGFHAEIDNDKVVIKKGEKSAAWSDEDEENLQHCCMAISADGLHTYEDKQDMEVWLKSIKNRIGG